MTRARAILAALVLTATVAAAVALAAQPLLAHAGAARWHPGEAHGGRLALVGGLAVLELSGTPAERGRQMAALVGHQSQDLLAVMRLNPKAVMADGDRLTATLAHTRAGDLDELGAFAAAVGVPAAEVLLANATIETMCSAVAHLPSATVARNMDFFPPGPLGRATVVQVVREPGRRTYAAVGWPAMVGVISGMNDAGLSACILLNWRGDDPPPGEPLAFRVRAILQDCADVEEGLTALGASAVGSRHYVLLADASDAAVAWWTPQGLRVDRASGPWLLASNWIREGGGPRDDDLRGGCLLRACTALGDTPPSPAWFRRVLSASYMPLLNAQAMVFDHRGRRLELALARGLRPAATLAWRVLDLGPLLDGAPAGEAEVRILPPEAPMRHYLLGGGAPLSPSASGLR